MADVKNAEELHSQEVKWQTEYVVRNFGKCRVYRDKAKARDEALRLHKSCGYMGYGVAEVQIFGSYPGGDGSCPRPKAMAST